MPIYEYECTSCHHKFDLMQKISDQPVKQCPQCFEETAIRLVSAAGFQLKGSGWYATDFKNKAKPEAKKENTGEKSTEKKNDKVESSSGSSKKGDAE